MYSHDCSLDGSYGTYWESLFEHQDISSLVIISFILVTCMFDHVVILKGEVTCWSALGGNGLLTQIIRNTEVQHNRLEIPTTKRHTTRLSERLNSVLP